MILPLEILLVRSMRVLESRTTGTAVVLLVGFIRQAWSAINDWLYTPGFVAIYGAGMTLL